MNFGFDSSPHYHIRDNLKAALKYSERSKSGRPDFSVFEKRPVVNPSGFQTTSEIQMISSSYRTSGPFTSQRPDFECPVPNRPKPVWNRFQTGFGLKTGTKTGSKPVWNRFRTGFGLKTGTKTGLEPVLVDSDIYVRLSDV